MEVKLHLQTATLKVIVLPDPVLIENESQKEKKKKSPSFTAPHGYIHPAPLLLL